VSVISDLHVTTPEASRLALAAVRKAIAAKPDAIVIPGDFVNLMPEGDDSAHLRAALRPLADFGGPDRQSRRAGAVPPGGARNRRLRA
jgi:3',5'-cyclic AMP phosphodiesterase CpdA